MANPTLYQINTRVWLTERSAQLGRRATLDDFPDSELDRFAALGFDWLWFLGVWRTGEAGRRISRSNPEWLEEYARVLPDLRDSDICGSCFAVSSYTVSTELGGNEALARLRNRVRRRGMRVMLDFVPNHTAPDHHWVYQHPEYYVQAADGKLELGRDPNFPGWPDTLQLNYGNPALQDAMRAELSRIAAICDGVRCDMAMLLLPDVFQRTWGIAIQPFWPDAIAELRRKHPGFLLLAEVYWDLEWTMLQQGFDYAYDKRLYDRLREGRARPVRDHFCAEADYHRRMARFLENHDEPRAAATFPREMHEAAAVLTFLTPGLHFFHDGQFEGRQKRVPTHLCRAPIEVPDKEIQKFYARLLSCLQLTIFEDGLWQLLECVPAWDGNPTADGFIAFAWLGSDGRRLLVTVNYAPNQGQCYVRLPFVDLPGRTWCLRDLMGPGRYERDGNDLQARGLYLDMPAWGYHVWSCD